MLKRKINDEYVPAAQEAITVVNCPVWVDTSSNGGFMKVINGVWAAAQMFALSVVNHTLRVVAIRSTVDTTTNSFALPSEAGVSVSNHILVRS